MNVTETFQVVRAPDEPWNEDIERQIVQLMEKEPPLTRKAAVKILIGDVLHRLGIHTWVRHKRLDDRSVRLIDVGIVCLFCSAGKHG